MTPKKKAKELVGKFRQVPPSSPYTGIDNIEAKQCAFIAVDEILKLHKKVSLETLEFYQEVKQEIEKL